MIKLNKCYADGYAYAVVYDTGLHDEHGDKLYELIGTIFNTKDYAEDYLAQSTGYLNPRVVSLRIGKENVSTQILKYCATPHNAENYVAEQVKAGYKVVSITPIGEYLTGLMILTEKV